MTIFSAGEKLVPDNRVSSNFRQIGDRINILRFLLIFGIVMLHTPVYVPLAEIGSSFFDFIKALFQNVIFRCSVPVLTCISGYLLFKASLDQKYLSLVVKKVQTLLIPLVLFNLPVVVLIYVVQSKQLLDHEFSQSLYPIVFSSWVDAIFGLFSQPANYPLNFLRDLFVISLMAPLLGVLLRYAPWPGLLMVFGLFWFGLDGNLVLRDDMPIMFFIGGMAAICHWDLRSLDKYGPWLLSVFLLACVLVVVFKIENLSYLLLASPFLIWPAASLLVNTGVGAAIAKLASFSFLIFLVHGPILLVSWIVYQKALPGVPYWIYWVATPVIVTVFSIGLHKLGNQLVPGLMGILLGGRGKGGAVPVKDKVSATGEYVPVSGFGKRTPREISGFKTDQSDAKTGLQKEGGEST